MTSFRQMRSSPSKHVPKLPDGLHALVPDLLDQQDVVTPHDLHTGTVLPAPLWPGWGGGGGGGGDSLFPCCSPSQEWMFVSYLTSQQVYLGDGSARTIVRAVTLRQKLQIKLSIPSSHSILTPGQPVPVLTL